jgi:spoIIIJ-associated protein
VSDKTNCDENKNLNSESEKFLPEDYTKKFLERIIEIMELEIDVVINVSDNNLNIELTGQDAKCLIGRHGLILDSLQYIIDISIHRHGADFNVIVDAENYRKKHQEALEHQALKNAQKVLRTRKKIELEPMTSYERLIMHKVLQKFPDIYSYSNGDGERRHVVIDIKSKI